MANKQSKKKSLATRIILIVALVFLVIGMSTLGSFYSAGDAYELKTQGNSAETPTVIFRLTNPSTTDEHGHSATQYLRLKHIYVNIGAAYIAEGETTTIRAEVAASTTGSVSNSRRFDYTFGNFVSATEAGAQEDGEEYPNIYYSWQDMVPADSDGWSISSYRYVRLTARDANVLLNEVVFVGEVMASSASNAEGTGEIVVIPATIESATPLMGETEEEAAARAAALLDSQVMPSLNSFRMNKLSDEETLSMMTIREMYTGAEYGEGNIYTGERVYGSVGEEILALGTLIFGMSPFGLRFFPMLAAAGALVCGAFLARRIAKKDAAGIIFAVLFALACAPLALGGLGTPLMIGVFFFLLSVNSCHYFYANGMRTEKFASALPLLVSGLAGALAILTHGAYLVPMVGVVALFACGMVRMRRARRVYLDKAIAEVEAEETAPAEPAEAPAPSAPAPEEDARPALSPARRKVAAVAAEYRNKTSIALVTFLGALVVGAFVLGLILATPMYFTWLKLFDNPASPSMNIIALAATAFAGGFTGVNPGGMGSSAWNVVYSISRVSGEAYSALYASVINFAALIAVLFAVVSAVVHLVMLCRTKEWGREERAALRGIVIPAVAIVIALVTAIFAKDAVQFVLLAYIFAFVLAASEAVKLMQTSKAKLVRILCWVELALLVIMFVLLFVFTTGLPVASGLLTAIAG